MRRRPWFVRVVGLIAATVFISGAAQASVVKKSIPELIAESDGVIRGKAKGAESYWSENIIVTDVTIGVTTGIFGIPDGGEVTVTIPGGTVGGVRLEVSDTPQFRRGGDSVLFLKGTAAGGYALTGAFQGKVDVEGGLIPAWGMPVDEFVTRVGGGGLGLEESPAKPDNPGGGKGGGGGGKEDPGYKLCKLDWKANGDLNGGKVSPAGGWMINEISGLSGDVAAALQAAADEWDNAAGACWNLGGYTDIISDNSRDGSDADGENLVTFGDTGSSVATTYNWYYRWARRNIIETDLVFNIVDHGFGVEVCGSDTLFDLREVATHEFGHFICLGDQYEDADTEKTMFGYVDFGECNKRDLFDSDKAGAQAVYGACN